MRVVRYKSNLITLAERNLKLRKTTLRKTNANKSSKPEPIKSDLYQTLFPIYHLSKICGLLPVRFSPIGGGLYSGKLYKTEVVYGFVLILICILSQFWGLWRDLRHGWENSSRLSSDTAMTVTFSDVITVSGVIIITISSFPYRWKYLQITMNKLAKVDEKIGIVTIKKLQKTAIILITCPLLFLIVISFLDYFTWLHSNKKKHLTPREDRGPINYSPMYIMYFVITVFEIQYALAALYLGERFARMNKVIERLSKNYKINEYFKRDLGLGGEFKHQSQMPSDEEELQVRQTKVFDYFLAGNDNKSIADGISLLITLHEDLCDSILSLNAGFGLPLLFATLSCLVHLIITPYFVYTEIYDEYSSWKVIAMKTVWTFYHIMGLLITVQPSYWSTLQVKETGIIISELLTFKWDPEIRKQLEIFSLQMLHRPLNFSACGLFFMDRSLVTSIAGAVTTYLIILIQFQDGDSANNTIRDATEIIKKANALET